MPGPFSFLKRPSRPKPPVEPIAPETRLKVTLLPGWVDVSDQNPDGPPTYVRQGGNMNYLKVSYALYKGGVIPNPSYDDLINLAKRVSKVDWLPELVSTTFGDCAFGRYGAVVYRSLDLPHIQCWHMSNGRDFIMVTYICPAQPSDAELAEAQQIALLVTLNRP